MTVTQRKLPGSATGAGGYDCFLSYARQPDQALAHAVRKALAGLAKPWYRRRALRVFLDTASLPASSELGGSIVQGLERARFFVLLASAEAATRPWVDREVAWWREHREPQTFLLADCGAGLRWDEQLGDFAADAEVPPSLRGWFAAEPTWTDLSWTRAEQHLSIRNSRFSGHVADLAAPMRGMSKDALVDEDIRQHRRSLRLAWGAAVALTLLAVAATVAAIIAVSQRHEALAQRDRAQARALAALAEASRPTDPLTSLRQATQSLAIDPTQEGTRALRGTLALPLRRVFNVLDVAYDLKFSPDGRRLAQSGRGGVTLWDLKTGRSGPASATGLTFIRDFGFDASGRTLLSVGETKGVVIVQIADLASGSRPRAFRFDDLSSAALAPDGGSVALLTYSGRLALRDLRTGHMTVLDHRAGEASGLQFSPDGKHVVAIGSRGLVVWPTTRPIDRVDIRSESLLQARFTSADTIVGISALGDVTTWSLDGTQRGHERIRIGPDADVDLSPDGRLIAVGSTSSVVVWDTVSGGRRLIGTHPAGGIRAVAFGPRARSLASMAEGDGLVRLWDLQTAPPALAHGIDFAASILTASLDRSIVAAADRQSSALAVWTRDGTRQHVFHGGDESIVGAGFMPDGREILTVSDDGAARLVDAATGERRVVRDRLGPVEVAALSPDRRQVAVAADDGPLRVWNLAGGPPVTLARRTHRLFQLAFSADGRVAATHFGTRYVEVWSARGGKAARLAAPETIGTVEFSPSGHALAGGGAQEGGVFLWRRLQAGAKPVRLGSHRNFVDAFAFSPDGSSLAVAFSTPSGPKASGVYLWPLDGSPGVTLAEGTGGPLLFDRTGTRLLILDGGLRMLSCEACGSSSRVLSQARALIARGGLPSQ